MQTVKKKAKTTKKEVVKLLLHTKSSPERYISFTFYLLSEMKIRTLGEYIRGIDTQRLNSG